MAFTNNVMIVRHGLLAKLVKLWKENRLLEEIDRLPIELSPRKSKVIGRCCVHKERAVWKYKTLPLLGFDMQDEVDELTPLSEYAKQALLRSENKKENLMCVVDEACSSCVQVNYEITNLCRGCVARSCYMNCPKDAIRFKKNGQAEIDHDTCISCGKCHQNCPYHAIVYIPIPCEEVCPVKAISKDEYGVEHIDESKCIYCGKCVNACPFGAIFEISQVFDILQRLRNKEPMVAIVAPSILAQFAAPVEKVYGAIKSLGFLEVVESIVKLHIVIDCIGAVLVAHIRVFEDIVEVVLRHEALVVPLAGETLVVLSHQLRVFLVGVDSLAEVDKLVVVVEGGKVHPKTAERAFVILGVSTDIDRGIAVAVRLVVQNVVGEAVGAEAEFFETFLHRGSYGEFTELQFDFHY